MGTTVHLSLIADWYLLFGLKSWSEDVFKVISNKTGMCDTIRTPVLYHSVTQETINPPAGSIYGKSSAEYREFPFLRVTVAHSLSFITILLNNRIEGWGQPYVSFVMVNCIDLVTLYLLLKVLRSSKTLSAHKEHFSVSLVALWRIFWH